MKVTQAQRDAVAAGVALFDRVMPDWRQKTKPEKLDVGDCNDCPGGQVFGSYYRAKVVLGLRSDEVAAAFGLAYMRSNTEYPVLTRLWLEIANLPLPTPTKIQAEKRDLALV